MMTETAMHIYKLLNVMLHIRMYYNTWDAIQRYSYAMMKLMAAKWLVFVR